MNAIDTYLFNLITIDLKNPVFDYLMPILSDASYWKVPFLVLIASFLFFGKKQGVKTIFLCLLAVGLTDYVCGNIIKPFIHRPRPLGGITMSFPSNHTANLFAAATVILYFYRKFWVGITAFSIASLVGYSRVYTTSHYPSDVFGGIFFGMAFAVLVIFGYDLYLKRLEKKHRHTQWTPYDDIK